MERCLPDILVIEETKLTKDYKKELFVMNNYQYPMRRDRDEFGGGLMQYVRKGVVCNPISKYETLNIESTCSELTIKRLIFAVYRPPNSTNLVNFFNELTNSLNSALDKYDNIMVLGDFKHRHQKRASSGSP